MKIIIEGVEITLNASQVWEINKERKKRERCRNSFVRMLKHFGFKKYPECPNCYEHPIYEWWAEIHNYGNYDSVWMVGKGLRDGGFSGGYTYDEPELIEREILKALNQTAS